MIWFLVMVLAILLISSVAYCIYQRYCTRKLLDRLNLMLNQAIAGTFTENEFDESMLSAVETRLAQFLAASVISARNLQTEKEKIKTLIADISHQTRTPMANIRLYSQLLEEQPLGEQGYSCVEALDLNTEKLQNLIEALVKTSRLETGILALHPEQTDLQTIITRTVSQFILKAEQKNITLKTESQKLQAFCDPKWTEEALCNLLDNAIKYTPERGHIVVRALAYEMFCRIDVQDDGPGIPEEEHAKIFGRFYRGVNVCQKQGVGIGLYLTRQIASGQGGYVKVSSKVGEGSTFSLFLKRR